jgi:hypothetical protein
MDHIDEEDDKCSMSSTEYEEVTRDVAKSIVEQVEGASLPESGKENHKTGRSGHQHQIDVSFSNKQTLVLVECKCWGNRVPVGRVLEFAARLIDIQIAEPRPVNGVMVTTVGFQQGAKTVADFFNIELWLLTNATEFAATYKDLIGVGIADAIRTWSDAIRVRLE